MNQDNDRDFINQRAERRVGDEILDFDATDVQHAIRAYPVGKKPGIDCWSTEQWRDLPPEIISLIASTLFAIQRYAFWPIQVMLNLESLIAKPLGGQRPIAKTPFLYRVWNAIRAPLLRQWSSMNCPEWDTASKGRSAEIEAAARL